MKQRQQSPISPFLVGAAGGVGKNDCKSLQIIPNPIFIAVLCSARCQGLQQVQKDQKTIRHAGFPPHLCWQY
jgi:hypothetical protein